MKTFRLHVGMPCQAMAVMNAMDYDVYLYTDAETGEDAIVYRAGPTGLRLARQRLMHPPSMPVALPLTINSRKVPVLSPAEAAERLAAGWLPFLFFTERDSGRGNLLDRRYDGDLSLIPPPSYEADSRDDRYPGESTPPKTVVAIGASHARRASARWSWARDRCQGSGVSVRGPMRNTATGMPASSRLCCLRRQWAYATSTSFIGHLLTVRR